MDNKGDVDLGHRGRHCLVEFLNWSLSLSLFNGSTLADFSEYELIYQANFFGF